MMRCFSLLFFISTFYVAVIASEYGSYDDEAGHIPPQAVTHQQSEEASAGFFADNHHYAFPHKVSSRLVMYVQTFMTPQHKTLSLLPLLDHETKITHVILASLHLHDKPGVFKLNDHDHDDDTQWHRMWAEVKILQKAGIKVMALLGGAATGSYAKLNGTEEEFYKYYHPLLDLVKSHGLDGIDIDIEEGVGISVPLRLLNAFYRDMGPDFIMTMSPLCSALVDEFGQNASDFSYFELDRLATVPGSEEKLVSWYNGQFYGAYPHGVPPYESVVARGWDPNRIVMGVLCSPNDGGQNGFLHIEQLTERVKDLRERYPGFGGIAGWEYHDAGDVDRMEEKPWEWVKEVGKALFWIFPKTEL